MNRRWLQGHLPSPGDIHTRVNAGLGLAETTANQPIRRWLKRTFAQPMVWHLNRRSVAGGVAVGLFVSWLPIPLQMLVAAILAAVLRVHVPVSVVMVWFTNPLTVAPLLYAAWHSGSMILGSEPLDTALTLSIPTLISSAGQAWPTLLVGSLFCALVSAVAGFSLTLLLWRLHAIRRWRNRRAAHRSRQTPQKSDRLRDLRP